jgi:nucleotide-binding universal stress UspA family protein
LTAPSKKGDAVSYKTILVHVDQSPRADARIALAARLAAQHGAHLVGLAATGIPRHIFYGSNVDIARTVIEPELERLTSEAEAALARFEAIAGGVAGVSFEKRLVDEDEGPALATQALYADLVVLSQSDPAPVVRLAPELPAYVLLHSPCPVLVTPFAGAPPACGAHPMVGWNESVQARRAVANAVPLLQRARTVSLAIFNAAAAPRPVGADIALFLARHGINIEVISRETELEVAYALLELAREIGADVLVIGGYGHARFREVVLGGATQTILTSMTLPVLISH